MFEEEMKNSLCILGNWLKDEAVRIIDGCRILSFDNCTYCYTPDATGFYRAMWTRDFCYMADGFPDAFTCEELRKCCLYLLEGQRDDGVIPDRRQADGMSIYCAGWCEKPIGEPPTDNSQFLVKLICSYVKQSGDLDFFSENSNRLECAMSAIPRDTSGLVWIDPAIKRSPYGFTDQIGKTGHELFSSLLFYEAAQDMAELYGIIGDTLHWKKWQYEKDKILRSLDMLWKEEDGAFYAADIDCRQLDVWGSAYAAYSDIIQGERQEKISRWLAKNYDAIVSRGHVRHLTYPEYWKNLLYSPDNGYGEDFGYYPKPGTYQNGAYWATPAAWVSGVIRLTDPRLADQMLLDLIEDFKKNGINEAFNDETGYVGARDYAASVTLILGELRRLGFH